MRMDEGEKPACLSGLCFMSDHKGFQGTIKHSTRDFVVTEISISGQLVNKAGSCQNGSHQLSDIGEVCLTEKSQIAENVKHITADDSREKGLSAADGDGGDAVARQDVECDREECFDLDVILGRAMSEELEEFATSVRLRSGSTPGQTPVSTELSLGTFPGKHQRSSVHRAVRHNFPFLMTITNQTEIRVKEDPSCTELSGLVSETEAEDFFRFIDAKVPNSVFTFEQDDSKEHRRAVHHFLSKRFGKLVETKSFSDVSSGGQQKTAITVRLRERTRPAKKRTAADCEEERVRYTGFTLKKENLETLEAISYMASVLGVLPSDFTYAGIKDKRAITFQAMVVKKVSPEWLKEKIPELEKKGMQLSHIHPVSEPLHLGRLLGNHFDLVVRDVKPHSDDSTADLTKLVQEAVDNVKAKGFVNYYGPQRFGAAQTVQADQIGLALLKEEMVTAVKLFFTPEEGDDPQNRAKSHFLQTENAKESLALMPVFKVRERLMLRALHRYGAGHEGSARGWLSLPHAMRVFYIHAYCSRVWNEGATFRLEELGHRVVQGDLVWTTEGQDGSGKQQIHVVSAAEEADKVYSLGQVLLPMPGNSVKYPENVVGAWYQERLRRDGLQSCRFRVTPLKLNIPGCYRPLLAYPRNFTHQLQGLAAESGSLSHPPAAPSLALSFDLDASCYATVCLREIMKCDS